MYVSWDIEKMAKATSLEMPPILLITQKISPI